jgi:hypothetical protein
VARSKRTVGCLVIVVVLGLVCCGGATIADRIVRGVAQDRLADAIKTRLAQRDAPVDGCDVSIDGFPVITQIARRKFEGGTIKLTGVRTANLDIAKVDLHVTDIRVPSDVGPGTAPHDVKARRVDGTFTVRSAEIAKRVNLPGLALTSAAGGVRASVPLDLPIVGKVTATATVIPKLTGKTLTFRLTNVQAAGVAVPDSAVAELISSFTKGFDLDVPYVGDLNLDKVTVRGGDLLVTGSAANVEIA